MDLKTRARRRRAAMAKLDRLDAEVARWYVYDGQLSEKPLGHGPSESSLDLRARRLKLVAELERFGGQDPWPTVLRKPTDAQRALSARRTNMPDLVSITMERQDAADLAVALESLQNESDDWAAFEPLIRGSVALRDALHVEDVVDAADREMERRA